MFSSGKNLPLAVTELLFEEGGNISALLGKKPWWVQRE